MTFYQELQLDQAGSKKLIQNTEGLKNKLRHTTVYLFKIFLTIVFCVAFVSAYSGIFGSENSIVGVVVLLCLMVFRFADFGVKTGSGLAILFLQFFILAVGPRLANIVPSGAGMIVHVVSISFDLAVWLSPCDDGQSFHIGLELSAAVRLRRGRKSLCASSGRTALGGQCLLKSYITESTESRPIKEPFSAL
mgnify:CR=1 FL=1